MLLETSRTVLFRQQCSTNDEGFHDMLEGLKLDHKGQEEGGRDRACEEEGSHLVNDE